MSEVSEPVFDAGGKYLYFFASTDAGPVKQWFSMSNADMVVTRSLYLAVLAKGVESPLKPESDEETGEKADEESSDGQPDEDTPDQDEVGRAAGQRGTTAPERRPTTLPPASAAIAARRGEPRKPRATLRKASRRWS